MAQYRSAYTGQQIDTAIDTVYNLAEVATSGDYDDLINKPSIPSISVSDIQVNGTSILNNEVANLVTETAYDASSNKIATVADVAEAESFIVRVTSNSDTEIDGQHYYPTDKTFAQAKAALEAGKTVKLIGYDGKFLGDACYCSTTKIQFMNIQYARGSDRMTYTTYWYDLTSNGMRDHIFSDNVGKPYNTQTISLINTLPTTPGAAGQMIYSDGSRVLKWMDIPVIDIQANGTSIISNGVANLVTETAYNSSTNKIATMSDVGTMTIRTWSGAAS